MKLPYFCTKYTPLFCLNDLTARDSTHFSTLCEESEQLRPLPFTVVKKRRTSAGSPITWRLSAKDCRCIPHCTCFHLGSVCCQCSVPNSPMVVTPSSRLTNSPTIDLAMAFHSSLHTSATPAVASSHSSRFSKISPARTSRRI